MQIYETFFLIARGVVTTGYHVDGPENLLIQVTGTKATAFPCGWKQGLERAIPYVCVVYECSFFLRFLILTCSLLKSC